MGRRHYVPMRRHHDIPIRRREDVPLRRLGDVPLRRHWVFHLRCTCDVTGTYRETSLRRRHDVLLPGGQQLHVKPKYIHTYINSGNNFVLLVLLLKMHINIFLAWRDLRAVIRKCSSKQVFLKTFSNFTGKHLYWSLFLIKVQALRLTQMLSCEICEIFKNTIFYRTPPVAASGDPLKHQFTDDTQ